MQTKQTPHPGSRTGISLLEVIIATVVLAMSAAILIRLISSGDRQASRADRRVMAQMICQNKLDEILSAVEPIESFDPRPSRYFPGWYYSVSVQDYDSVSDSASDLLALVDVKVYFSNTDDTLDESSPVNLRDERPVYSLKRLIRRQPAVQSSADSSSIPTSGEFE